MSERHHRLTREQCNARGTGLTCHGPKIGVPGEGPLGVHHHRFARVDGGDGRPDGLAGIRALSVDRDLARPADDASGDGDLEN